MVFIQIDTLTLEDVHFRPVIEFSSHKARSSIVRVRRWFRWTSRLNNSMISFYIHLTNTTKLVYWNKYKISLRRTYTEALIESRGASVFAVQCVGDIDYSLIAATGCIENIF